MNTPNYFYKLSFSLFVLTVVGLSMPQKVFCQTEKLGTVSYTPPKDWTKTMKENIVAFSEFNQATGRFCVITLYGATPGTGNPNEMGSPEMMAHLPLPSLTNGIFHSLQPAGLSRRIGEYQ